MRSTRNLVRFASVSALLVAGVFGSKSAHAEADTFGLGSGRTGAGSITTAGTVVNAYAGITANVAVNATTITTSNGAAFAPGDLVLIWQTTGVATALSGSQVAVSLSGAEPTGSFEYARVKSVAANVVTLTNPTVGAYAANVSQIVKVPEYTTLSIAAGGSITAAPWDGAKGGIVVIFATGAVTNAGTISADASGFRGGVIKNDLTIYSCSALDGPVVDSAITPGQNALAGGAKKGEGLFPADYSTDIVTDPTSAALSVTYGRGNITSGGGGGDCHNSGGGGGGHGGIGGQGGNTWSGETPIGSRPVGGLGGAEVTYDALTRLTFGGGGGAGEENNGVGTDGGNGGGVVVLRADALAGAGTITANGGASANSANDGAGGGGAGGLVVVRVTGNATCGGIEANGGAGGHCDTDHGPGAGGSGGVVLLQSATSSCTATEAAGPNGDDGSDAGRNSDPGSGGVTKTPPTGGYSPAPCDQAVNACGGCVTSLDCTGTEVCNTTTNKCTLADGGVPPGDGGASTGDAGSNDGGSSTTDGGSSSDGGSGTSDGGSGADGGSGTGDAGLGGDGGNGNGNGNNAGDDTGDLEGGGCSTSGTTSDGTGAVALGLGLVAALAFLRRKKK
jgi:MYXO-CTERM domain-containing protein